MGFRVEGSGFRAQGFGLTGASQGSIDVFWGVHQCSIGLSEGVTRAVGRKLRLSMGLLQCSGLRVPTKEALNFKAVPFSKSGYRV